MLVGYRIGLLCNLLCDHIATLSSFHFSWECFGMFDGEVVNIKRYFHKTIPTMQYRQSFVKTVAFV